MLAPRRSGSGRAGGRASDAFGGGALRAGDLPGGGDDYFDNAPYPEEEEVDAPPPADEEYQYGGFGGGLSAPYDSLLETAPDGTQTQRGPEAALSGVTDGVRAYFAAAWADADAHDKAFLFGELCTANKCACAAALALVDARLLRW